ncbi:MAG: glycosyltransferase family 2 protein [Stenotrophobium sp.]
MSAPKVSVVLPTYNRADTLGRAIQSVLAQSYADLELIVVDDASTDATPQVVAGFRDPRVRYLPSRERLGVSRARNLGIGNSSGELIAFQDSDDEWRVEKLAKQVQVFAAHPSGVSLVLCGDLFVNCYPLSFTGVDSAEAVVDVTEMTVLRLPPAPCWLVPRERLIQAGCFDVQINCYEDWELALRLSESGRILMVNEPLTLRQRTPNSLASTEQNFIPNLKRILDRHGERLRAHPVAWVMYCNVIGQTECQYGSAREGRIWFRKALAAKPLAVRTWANLACSWFGRRVFSTYVRVARDWRSRYSAQVRPPLYRGNV